MSKLERIIPLIVYKDIQAAHDFLVQAFGFEGGGVERNTEGQPIHGEVRAGSATMPYGQREYGARDSEGHRWWFFTPKHHSP